MVDIGTGDGTFAYQIAKENPNIFVIGIDPCHENLIDISSKALRKPQKGGLKNVLYVLSNIENLSEELNGIADKVYINFPWGSLLQGIVLVNDITWKNIKKICKPNAEIHLIFGYHISYDQKEVERLALPNLDESYVKNIMLTKIRDYGFKAINVEKLEPKDLKKYSTTWAKKLSFGSERIYYKIILKNVE